MSVSLLTSLQDQSLIANRRVLDGKSDSFKKSSQRGRRMPPVYNHINGQARKGWWSSSRPSQSRSLLHTSSSKQKIRATMQSSMISQGKHMLNSLAWRHFNGRTTLCARTRPRGRQQTHFKPQQHSWTCYRYGDRLTLKLSLRSSMRSTMRSE